MHTTGVIMNSMFIALLGRQPELSLAELEAVFSASKVQRVSKQFATIKTATFYIDQLGGTVKCGKIIRELPLGNSDKQSLKRASKYIIKKYGELLSASDGKITLGISTYNLDASPHDIQKTGLALKNFLKKFDISVRLIPNKQSALSTATSHNNKLGSSQHKIELMIIRTNLTLIIAESRGVQNITAYTRRDRNRPKRDAFVGMLPPKLAQIMINLATGVNAQESGNSQLPHTPRPTQHLNILDPFCGTGTVLQESLLRSFHVYGSDLSQKMVDYSRENLKWLQTTHRIINAHVEVSQADATTHHWPKAAQLDAVICETYLGQPFSAPPKPEKLREVINTCDHIISAFLQNLRPQISNKTSLCIAIPAWRGHDDTLSHLPLLKRLDRMGYSLQRQPLVYARPDQVVAREILVLKPASALDNTSQLR